MYFAPLTDYDRAMKQIPCGKVIIVWKIWEYFAGLSGADFTEPITAGICAAGRHFLTMDVPTIKISFIFSFFSFSQYSFSIEFGLDEMASV